MRPAPALRSGGRLWWSLGSCRCCTWRWARSVWRSRSSACSSRCRCSDRPEPETQEVTKLRLWTGAVTDGVQHQSPASSYYWHVFIHRAVCVWACTWLTALACWACTASLNCSRAWNWLFLVNVMIFSTKPNLLKIWKQTRNKRVHVFQTNETRSEWTEHFILLITGEKPPLKSVSVSEAWKE